MALGNFLSDLLSISFEKYFIALLSLPPSLKTFYNEAGHCMLRIISSFFQALHCSEPLHDRSLEYARSSYGNYTSMSAF